VFDEETLSARATVAVDRGQVIEVQISEHNYGEYWKVTAAWPGVEPQCVISTTEDEESFLWHLIHRALRGDQTAWADLGRLGTHPTFAGARRSAPLPAGSPGSLARSQTAALAS
jgi:hypothetical protein